MLNIRPLTNTIGVFGAALFALSASFSGAEPKKADPATNAIGMPASGSPPLATPEPSAAPSSTGDAAPSSASASDGLVVNPAAGEEMKPAIAPDAAPSAETAAAPTNTTETATATNELAPETPKPKRRWFARRSRPKSN